MVNPGRDVQAAEMATVSVVGTGSIRVEPDEAFVSITITKIDSAPGPALAEVARRSEGLVALLDELAVPAADRSTTGITVQEEFDHTKEGRRALGYRAAATVSVRLTDTKLIGTVIMRCTQELDTRVAGPSWRISADHPVWLQAASQAAVNARQKATAYAAGLDLALGPIRSLAEPDGRSSSGPRRMARLAAAGQDMIVEVGEQEATATVHATFTLLPR